MSLFAKYIQERESKGIIEDDLGFATFYKLNDEQVYVEDVYVVPEERQKHTASDYLDSIAVIAKEWGMKSMVTTVKPSTNNSTESVKAILGYGFKLKAAGPDAILFEKEL